VSVNAQKIVRYLFTVKDFRYFRFGNDPFLILYRKEPLISLPDKLPGGSTIFEKQDNSFAVRHDTLLAHGARLTMRQCLKIGVKRDTAPLHGEACIFMR
jgi:hypothetical protein